MLQFGILQMEPNPWYSSEFDSHGAEVIRWDVSKLEMYR